MTELSDPFAVPVWDDALFAGLDFETIGVLEEYALQPWRIPRGEAWATSLSVMQRLDGVPVRTGGLMPTADDMRVILQDIIDRGQYVIGWNVPFDISILLAYGLDALVYQIKWIDAMLLWRHLFIEPEYDLNRSNKKSYGLKTAVAEFIPVYGDYADDVDFHDTSPEARAKLHKYNKRDTTFTWILAKMFWEDLSEQRRQVALIEAECLPMVAEANLRGMLVDTLVARELAQKLDDVAGEMLEKLSPYGVTEKVVRSPMQLSKLMFDPIDEGGWGLPVLKENTSKLTGKVTRSTDKEVLHELSFSDPRAAQLRLYREALGNRTKFADTPLLSADYNGDGYTRPSGIVFGTYSGRMTYGSKQGKGVNTKQTGFALHQEKRGAMFRSVITAPPGYTLVEFDASGQEFRWMAIASGDPVMLQLCEPGEDSHSYMGARVTSKDYREVMALVAAEDEQGKADRQLGKVANLSLQYRTSARKLRSVARVQYSIPMELPQAQLIHKTYQQSYSKVPAYWAEQIHLTKKRGYVETLAGRRVQVVGNWEGDMGWSMGSTAINYRIQGTGAEQKYLAMMLMKDYLRSIGGWFGWDLHDGLYSWIPDHKVEKAVHHIKHMLDNLPYERAWGFTPPITLPWDAKTGGSWGALKGYDFG